MSKLTRVAGFVWAAPLTLLGLLYVQAFVVLGWYKRVGSCGNAWVWQLVPEQSPSWLGKVWLRWGGHTIGNVVVVKLDVESPRGKVILRHEQEHVRQCMVLGIFQPVLYSFAYLIIKLSCPRSNPYYGNPLEIEARRAAGQVVDVEGTVAQLQARLRNASKANSLR